MANTFKFGNGNWAVKKDSVLAYNDENNNFKPLPFDFTRDTIGTYVDSDGLIKTARNGEARIDYLDNADGHLLLEPSRTNLVTQSNQFDTDWIGSGTSVLSGYLGLDGTNSAWLLTKTASDFANIRQNITFSGIHTFSVYLKKGTNTSAILRSTGGNDARIEINLIDGTTSGAVNTTSVLTESMGNDWWRCSMTLNASSNTAVRIYPEAPLGGTTAGNIYIQYAQLEAGSYATSYIPTNGSSVTRAAETFNQYDWQSKGILGSSEGTLFLDLKDCFSRDSTEIVYQFVDSSGNRIFRLYFEEEGECSIFRIYNNINSEFLTSNFTLTSSPKIAIVYDGTSRLDIFGNGQKITKTGSNLSSNAVVDGFEDALPINYNSTKFKEIKLYNTALSDSELETLTQV